MKKPSGKKRRFISNVERELEQVTNVRFTGRVSKRRYRGILVRKATKLTDEEFSRLSRTTQDYVNYAVNRLNEGSEAPDYPDVEEVYAARLMARQLSAERRVANKSISHKGAAGKIREIMWKKGLRISKAQIHRMLEQEGFKCSINTVDLVRTQFYASCLFLWENGLLKVKPKGM